MPLKMPITEFGGINVADQEDKLVPRSYQSGQGGLSQVTALECIDATNCDFTRGGIRKRKGSTEYRDFTSGSLNILVTGDELISGTEWVDPETGNAIQVIVSKKTIYASPAGSFIQLYSAAGTVYTHTAEITKCSFAQVDGHLFIGMDGNNPVQVYRNGTALDDPLDASLEYAYINFTSLTGENVLYVDNPTKFAVGHRIVIDEGQSGEQYNYVTAVNEYSLELKDNLTNSFLSGGEAIPNTNRILTTQSTWTERVNPKNFGLLGICHDGTQFISVGAADGTDAYIVTSPDGITWTERANPKSKILYGVTYGNGLFIAVGEDDGTDSYIVTSPDGITWTKRANPDDVGLCNVCYGNGLYVATGFADGTDAYIITSSDGITWTERANPYASALYGVTYGNSLFVAVGYADGTDAYIVTSPDGITWTERANPKNKWLGEICYGNGLFVAVGDADGTDAYIVTSPDGITWTERANPKNKTLEAVYYGNGIFVAVGSADGTDAYIVTSLDGVTWTERSNPKNKTLRAICHDGTQFVSVGDADGTDAYIVTIPDTNIDVNKYIRRVRYLNSIYHGVGEEARYFTSTDGSTWTVSNPRGGKTFAFQDIAYGAGVYVAVGNVDGTDPYVVTTTDRIIWTERSVGAKNLILEQIIFAESLFVAVGGADGTDAYIVTSPDGITWTERANPKNFVLYAICHDGTQFISVGDADGTDAYIITSPDGITWTERTNPKNIRLTDIIWDSTLSLFIAVGAADGTDAYIVTSPDGVTWTERANPKNILLYAIVSRGGLLVAAGVYDGTDAYTIYSSNGTTWYEFANPLNVTIYGACYGNNKLTLVGQITGTDPYILSVSFLVKWTERTPTVAVDKYLHGVCYGNSQFVAVGNATGTDTYIVTSPDGITWTQQTNSVNVICYKVMYGGGLYVSVGEPASSKGFIMTSPDGVTWTDRSGSNKNYALLDICYGNGLYVAVGLTDGTDGYILTSTNGTTWTERSNPKDISLYGICYGDGIYVAVGLVGISCAYIITSTDGINWVERSNPKNIVLYSVCFGDDLFVAVGQADTDAYLITSPDGIIWTERTIPTKPYFLRDIKYEDGLYVVVGENDGVDGYILVSTDGIIWDEQANPNDTMLYGVAYGNGLYVAVGQTDGTDAYIITTPRFSFVQPANLYVETYDTSTSHKVTGSWDRGTYMLSAFQTRLLMSTGNTLITYTPESYTSGSGIWDALGSTAGFIQATGNIRSLNAFAPYFADQISEALYVGTDIGFEVVSGFSESDRLIRIEGAKSPINHQSVVKSLNWLVYLTDDKNIMAINGANVVDLGRRLKSFGAGFLDGMSNSNSKIGAFGFYSREKKQVYFLFSADIDNFNQHCVVIDMSLGEPVQGEPQPSFEQRIRCLYWKYGSGVSANDWFSGIYQSQDYAYGVLPTGYLYKLDDGNLDLGTTNIITAWEMPKLTIGAPELQKQWYRIDGRFEGQTTGTPIVVITTQLDMQSSNYTTENWSLLVTTAGQVSRHHEVYAHSEILKMILSSSDAYTWIMYGLNVVFDVGGELLL